MNKEIRIIENMGKFHIEQKVKQTYNTGFLWWKKTTNVDVWEYLDIDGDITSKHYVKIYETLEEATKVAQEIKKGEIIHNI